MAYTEEKNNPIEIPDLAAMEREKGPSNFFRAIAQHPAGLGAFYTYANAIMGPGSVDTRTKEMAYLAASSINECAYCFGHHEKAALATGISTSEIQSIKSENDQSFTPQERAVLRFSRELTRNAVIEDDTRHDMQNKFSPEQFSEIAQVVALANFTNRINNGMDVPLEK